MKAVEVAEKVESAGAFAAKVDVEKAAASVENDAAQVEADKCAVIATEVSAKQVSVQADLDAAEPLVDQAVAALDTLNKKDLGEAKSLKKPPAGVDDITAVIIILLQNNPKDKSWNAATKMMSNVDKFMDTLKGFKQKIDDGEVPKMNGSSVPPVPRAGALQPRRRSSPARSQARRRRPHRLRHQHHQRTTTSSR